MRGALICGHSSSTRRRTGSNGSSFEPWGAAPVARRVVRVEHPPHRSAVDPQPRRDLPLRHTIGRHRPHLRPLQRAPHLPCSLLSRPAEPAERESSGGRHQPKQGPTFAAQSRCSIGRPASVAAPGAASARRSTTPAVTIAATHEATEVTTNAIAVPSLPCSPAGLGLAQCGRKRLEPCAGESRDRRDQQDACRRHGDVELVRVEQQPGEREPPGGDDGSTHSQRDERNVSRPGSTAATYRRVTLSQAGFRGDLGSRILSSGEESLRGHGTTEEVPG